MLSRVHTTRAVVASLLTSTAVACALEPGSTVEGTCTESTLTSGPTGTRSGRTSTRTPSERSTLASPTASPTF